MTRSYYTAAWLLNSLQVSLATVLISVVVGAPAGYVLSRGKGRIVGGYALLLFVVQALPIITAVIPLLSAAGDLMTPLVACSCA